MKKEDERVYTNITKSGISRIGLIIIVAVIIVAACVGIFFVSQNMKENGDSTNIPENNVSDVEVDKESEEVAKLPANALINLYEEYAGDEEGATEGKLHIGDYVDYNPIAKGVTQKTEKNGYVYVLKNELSGLADSVDNNYMYEELKDITEQKVTVKEDLKWRVLGVNGHNILITTEQPVLPDNPITENERSGFYMYGPQMYINGLKEIMNISKIYGNGDLAKSATGMSIEHINKLTGVSITEKAVSPSGIVKNSELGWNDYGTSYSFAAGTEVGWNPTMWINKKDEQTSPGIMGVADGYIYSLADEKLKTSTSAIRKSLLDYTGNSVYALASRATFASSDWASCGVGLVGDGMAFSGGCYFFSDGESIGVAAGIRPVVTLNTNVLGELQSTAENGVATWHIK